MSSITSRRSFPPVIDFRWPFISRAHSNPIASYTAREFFAANEDFDRFAKRAMNEVSSTTDGHRLGTEL